MKPIIKAVSFGILIFIALTGVLLILIKTSMPVNISCVVVADNYLSCDYSRWEFFRVIYNAAIITVAVLASILYWKKLTRN